MTEAHEQDDFEETLVRQVIEDNPPEEHGERPEWQEHIGWHRKEYIHLRGAESIQQVRTKHANPEQGVHNDKKPKNYVMHNMVLAAAGIALLCVLLFVRIKSLRRKTRRQY